MLLRTCLLLLALLAPLCSRAEAMYVVTLLPDGFQPADINNRGQIAGALYASSGGVHAALFADGVVTDLGTTVSSDSYANAVNDAGAIAGNFGGVAGPEHAFLYRDGKVTDIVAGTALGMNAAGDVVGQRYSAAGAAGFLYHDGVLTEPGYLGMGNISRAMAINDAGQVVGESNLAADEQAPTRPYLYDSGTLIDLGTLADRGVNNAVVINNAGQIAGYSDAGNGRMHVFFHEHGVMTDLGSFGGFDVTIGGMNQRGQVVGTGNTVDGPDVAFISRAGALVDLNTLIDPGAGWTVTNAIDINDGGQIIANACRDFACTSVRLDLASAVPEPCSAWLLLPGLVAVAGIRRKQAGRCRHRPVIEQAVRQRRHPRLVSDARSSPP